MRRALIALCLLAVVCSGADPRRLLMARHGSAATGGVSATAFIATWQTTSSPQSITLPFRTGYTYNLTVDWGDGSAVGTVTTYNDVDATHEYATAGTYTVTIEGTMGAWYFNNGGSKAAFRTVQQWGDVDIDNNGLDYAFYGVTTATYFADLPSTWASVGRLYNTFRNCTGLLTSPGVSALSSFSDITATWRGAGITTVPDLSSMTNLTTCARAFYGTTTLRGTVVALWDTNNFPNITNYENTFTGCTGLSNYGDIPNSWKGL